MILIVSNLEDLHARHVRTHLEALGHDVAIVDFGALGGTSALEHHVGAQNAIRFSANDGGEIEAGRVHAVWLRRPARPEVSRTLASAADRDFAQREWTHALDGALLAMDAEFVNPLAAQRACVKPLQLRRAHRLGFRVPDTLVTNDPAVARGFVSKHRGRVIHKSMTPHLSHPIFATRWQATDSELLSTLHYAPVIFQEAIAADSDIRVTVVGEEIFAARMETGPDIVDSRLDLDKPFEVCELPSAVADKCGALLDELGLVFGCIDLRLTGTDDYTFLEINPQGQFLYIEVWTGLPITAALGAHLASYDQ
jgi:glutathione synthase/RimK-type ligase-like ATP-grasp enzyme